MPAIPRPMLHLASGDEIAVRGRRLAFSIAWEPALPPGLIRLRRSRSAVALDPGAVLLSDAGGEIAWEPAPLAAGGGLRLVRLRAGEARFLADAAALPAAHAIAIGLRARCDFRGVAEAVLRLPGAVAACACRGGHAGLLLAMAWRQAGAWRVRAIGAGVAAPSWTALAAAGAAADPLVDARSCA